MNKDYRDGYSFPKSVLFDLERMKKLFNKKWFFVGTRGDVPSKGSFLNFQLFNESYFILHGLDGKIRAFVNRCAHQSARLVNDNYGKFNSRIVCQNHQWSYNINDGSLFKASRMPKDFNNSDKAKDCNLDTLELEEVLGLLFLRLGNKETNKTDLNIMSEVIGPYVSPYNLSNDQYKLAYHEREVLDTNWLTVMINNRECCHCTVNHKGLLKLFSDNSFNGSSDPKYLELFEQAVKRWESKDLPWRENAFEKHDCTRIARYPLKEGYKSTSFDGKPCSSKLIGPHKDYDEGTLSFWFNPNAWIHFTSDHIATNWVLPLSEKKCVVYTSWIVHKDAEENIDYEYKHMTDVWKVTNAEDVTLCKSMTDGANSEFYKPGIFSEDERHCRQFCNWYMNYSS